MNEEDERHTGHRRDQASPVRAVAPAAPWPEAADLPPLDQDGGLTGRLWTFGQFPTEEEETAGDLAVGLTSVGFIRAALRRTRWFWCTTAALGLLFGLVAFKAFPPSYQAQTSILLANNPFEQIGNAVLDDQAMAQSRTVAGAALRKLGLHEDPGIFVGQYTATVITNRVLAITVKATSYQTAMSQANALAASFLAFQKRQALALEALNNSSLQQSINEAKKNVASITAQVRALSLQPPSPAKRAQVNGLLAQRNEADADLLVLEQTNRANAAGMKVNTAALINGSQVLDPAGPLPLHAKKYLVLYVGGGLFAGLMFGLSIVILRALVSDRLRRRDDVARALGAPVKISVGKVRLSRWRPGPRGLAAAQSREIQQIVGHLGRTLPTDSPGVAALAVVPVDDPQVAALSLASLAVSCAQQGFQVAVADLCDGSPAARLLGFTGPGTQMIRADGTQLLVAVPQPDDTVPVGPLHRRSPKAEADESLATACGSAEVLLTLATVSPSLGAEHLAGWTRRAVAVVTAGGPSAARVQAVGDLIRLSGVELTSAVLVGADKTDESLGVLAAPSSPAPAGRGLGS